jgi:hypothetical protein
MKFKLLKDCISSLSIDELIIISSPVILVLALLFSDFFRPPKNESPPPQIVYSYRDSIVFIDKDTDKVILKLDNVEFRVLGKDSFMFGTKSENGDEILVCDEIPSNTYPTIHRTSNEISPR